MWKCSQSPEKRRRDNEHSIRSSTENNRLGMKTKATVGTKKIEVITLPQTNFKHSLLLKSATVWLDTTPVALNRRVLVNLVN